MADLKRTIRIEVQADAVSALRQSLDAMRRALESAISSASALQQALSSLESGAQRAASAVTSTEQAAYRTAAAGKELSSSAERSSWHLANVENAARQGTYALITLSQMLQDLPYGFRAVANNIEVLIQQLILLTGTTGGVRGAIRVMLGSLTGPTGLLLGFSAVSAAAVMFAGDLASLVQRVLNPLGYELRRLRKELQDVSKDFAALVPEEELERALSLFEAQLRAIKEEASALRQEVNRIRGLERPMGTMLQPGRALSAQESALLAEREQALRLKMKEQAALENITRQLQAQIEYNRQMNALREMAARLGVRIEEAEKEIARSRRSALEALQEEISALRERIALAQTHGRLFLERSRLELELRLIETQRELLSIQENQSLFAQLDALSQRLELERRIRELLAQRTAEQDAALRYQRAFLQALEEEKRLREALRRYRVEELDLAPLILGREEQRLREIERQIRRLEQLRLLEQDQIRAQRERMLQAAGMRLFPLRGRPIDVRGYVRELERELSDLERTAERADRVLARAVASSITAIATSLVDLAFGMRSMAEASRELASQLENILRAAAVQLLASGLTRAANVLPPQAQIALGLSLLGLSFGLRAFVGSSQVPRTQAQAASFSAGKWFFPWVPPENRGWLLPVSASLGALPAPVPSSSVIQLDLRGRFEIGDRDLVLLLERSAYRTKRAL